MGELKFHKASASAPGKVNLVFAVGALGEDGYHEAHSLYLALDLRERVDVVGPADFAISFRGNIPDRHLASIPTNTDNLVVKAAKALAEHIGRDDYLDNIFGVYKTVPVAGGMGGGSADAAATLAALAAAWGIGHQPHQLAELAAKLGADVPFALYGGVANGVGRGDQISPLPANQLPKTHWVLWLSEQGLSTPAVFARFDQMQIEAGGDPRAARELPDLAAEFAAVKTTHDLAGMMRNDLQASAIDLLPELQYKIEHLEKLGALKAMVSGSGPTIAALCESQEIAIQIAAQLSRDGEHAIATTGPAEGTIIEDLEGQPEEPEADPESVQAAGGQI